jgi:hypothetical protein
MEKIVDAFLCAKCLAPGDIKNSKARYIAVRNFLYGSILIKLHLSHKTSQFHKDSSSIIVNTYSYLVKNMYMYISHVYFYIVTRMVIVRQRLGKHIPEVSSQP